MKKAVSAAVLLGVLLPVAAAFADVRGEDRGTRPDRPASTDVRPERPDRPAPPVE